MLGVDVCEIGGQVLELLWLTMCYRDLMADKKDLPIEEEERNPGYKPPSPKSLKEIRDLDTDDESLHKYKQMLLGTPDTADSSMPVLQVLRMTMIFDEGSAPSTMDLAGDLNALKNTAIVVKEGVKYRLKIDFKVNREIISGLRYHHTVQRRRITMDKVSFMVGSYGPRPEVQEFLSQPQDAPCGMIARGQYMIKSRIFDDDKNIHLEWEWNIDVKKDWN